MITTTTTTAFHINTICHLGCHFKTKSKDKMACHLTECRKKMGLKTDVSNQTSKEDLNQELQTVVEIPGHGVHGVQSLSEYQRLFMTTEVPEGLFPKPKKVTVVIPYSRTELVWQATITESILQYEKQHGDQSIQSTVRQNIKQYRSYPSTSRDSRSTLLLCV